MTGRQRREPGGEWNRSKYGTSSSLQDPLFEQLWDSSEPLYRVYETPLSIQQNPPPAHKGHDVRIHTEIRKPQTVRGL